MATIAEIRENALGRAVSGKSMMNYAGIVHGFMERGIPADEINPRENVFTYRAWQALGRQVRKGEKGIKVITYIPLDPKRREDGTIDPKRPGGARPWSTTVFHISQTDPMQDRSAVVGESAEALEV